MGLVASGCGLGLAWMLNGWWLFLGLPAFGFGWLRGVGWRLGLLGGWLWGLSFYFTQIVWVGAIFEQRASSPLVAGVAGALAALWLSSFYALFGLCLNLLPRTHWLLRGVQGACVWTVCQWLQSLGAYGFPWGQWSVALTAQPYLIQLADVGGVWLVEWTLAFWNLLLGEWIAHRMAARGSRPQPIALAAALLGIAVLWWGYGAWCYSSYNAPAAGIAVGVLQYSEDIIAERAQAAYNQWCAEGKRLRLDWLILPELTARYPSDEWARWQQCAQRFGGAILLGVSRQLCSDTQTNSACVLSTTHEPVCYDKVKLMPFTEQRFPFAAVGFMRALGVDLRKTVQSGELLRALPHEGTTRVGALICFESMFGWIGRGMVKDGAQWLTVLSNDAWLPSQAVRRQFAQYCALRAVETRRWVGRASPVGISGFFAPTGALVSTLPTDKAGLLTHPIEPRVEQTLYVRWGDWWVYGCWAGVLAALLGTLRRNSWAKKLSFLNRLSD